MPVNQPGDKGQAPGSEITCIDFETANPFWGSICAVGVAAVRGGEAVMARNVLVKPHGEYGKFNRDNIRVHGITPAMVESAPEFPVVYEELGPLIENSIVAAHNTEFDINCLKDALTIYGLPIPSFEYFCSCELSRAVWKGLKNYKLKTVSKHLGYVFKHHDAGADALACANIIIRAMEETGISDIRALAEKTGVKIKSSEAGAGYELSSVRHARLREERFDARKITAETKTFDPGHPFFEKEIVFTGQFLNGMSRQEAMQLAVNAGARAGNYVRYKTDFLVAGEKEGSKAKSGKMRKAKKLAEAGEKIRIMGEEEFFKLLAHKRVLL